jgi:DNA-directed RNA polymerase II subunit RPB1
VTGVQTCALPISIFRSGLLSDDVGPIAKATFEVHTEVLLNASRDGEFDHMRGVSANVMCGQFGNYGTGAFQVVLDMKEMEKLDAFDVNVTSVQESIEKGFEKRGTTGDCSKSDIAIQNNIANIAKDKTGNVCDDGYNVGF